MVIMDVGSNPYSACIFVAGLVFVCFSYIYISYKTECELKNAAYIL